MTASPERRAAFRNAIEHFLKERLDEKLKGLADDNPKRIELIARHARDTWLANAARRVTWIQIATHTLKPIHPDARGTNLFRAPKELPAHREVGSHSLEQNFSSDVV
ncbi:MAG: type I-F CRISPR-associated protein Csy1, partial [Betaproteobacteria bacterium HGW-Betaproteobacteria-21]